MAPKTTLWTTSISIERRWQPNSTTIWSGYFGTIKILKRAIQRVGQAMRRMQERPDSSGITPQPLSS